MQECNREIEELQAKLAQLSELGRDMQICETRMEELGKQLATKRIQLQVQLWQRAGFIPLHAYHKLVLGGTEKLV